MSARTTAGTGEREPAADIDQAQRAWVLAAAVKLSAEIGPRSLTVALIADRAGVSKRAFTRLFRDCDECLLAAIQEAVAHIAASAVGAYASEREWRAQLRAGLAALLACFDADPAITRLCVVDTVAAGPRILEYRRWLLAGLAQLVDQGRERGDSKLEPSPLAAQSVVGTVVHVLHDHLVQGSPEPLGSLLNPLMAEVVLPYLGHAPALEELHAPVEPQAPSPESALAVHPDAFDKLGLRLTYRTLRVLAAVQASPGSNNSEIALAAGIGDRGQISRLLTRLKTLGLIHNAARRSTRGAPNVWRLTLQGESLMAGVKAVSGESPREVLA
jgi:AcrR family transcriptional regulator